MERLSPPTPPEALIERLGKNCARATPICAFAAMRVASACSISGLRSSNWEGSPVGSSCGGGASAFGSQLRRDCHRSGFLGKQGSRACPGGEVEVWTRHLVGGALAVAVLNAGSTRYSNHPSRLNLTRLGLQGPQVGRDLWSGASVTLTDGMPIELATHAIFVVRIPAPK
jgi:hypothetical protein